MSTSEYPPGLRNYFREHNRRASWVALGSLVGALAAWALVYFLSEWLRLLILTSVKGLDAPNELFDPAYFTVTVATLLILGWLIGKLRTDHFKFSWILSLLHVLALPAQLTFGIAANLSARVHPSRRELEACWELLTALHQERKIPSSTLSAILGQNARPNRISYLLAIVELVDTDLYGDRFYLHLRNDRARSHVRRWLNSQLPEPS